MRAISSDDVLDYKSKCMKMRKEAIRFYINVVCFEWIINLWIYRNELLYHSQLLQQKKSKENENFLYIVSCNYRTIESLSDFFMTLVRKTEKELLSAKNEINTIYYPFQNRRRVTANWITRERKKLSRSGLRHSVAKTGARKDTWLKKFWGGRGGTR
jgi:hypothetical protein